MTDKNEDYLKLARDAFFSTFNRPADVETPQQAKFRAEVPEALQAEFYQKASRSFLAAHDYQRACSEQRGSPIWNSGTAAPA